MYTKAPAEDKLNRSVQLVIPFFHVLFMYQKLSKMSLCTSYMRKSTLTQNKSATDVDK